MPNSAELHEPRVASVARGVSHATAVYAKRAKDAEIWSEDGKRYIDFGPGIFLMPLTASAAIVRDGMDIFEASLTEAVTRVA
jgi:acetylornithine/succinyldiaminopimelate/putrescine aminotransferase